MTKKQPSILTVLFTVMLMMSACSKKQVRPPAVMPLSQIGKEDNSYPSIDMTLSSSFQEMQIESPVTENDILPAYLDTLYRDVWGIEELAGGSIRDGAYARAHALRRYLLSKGVQSDKIFAFGRLTSTSPQYGCCASWYYHVAVVIRAYGHQYVIDPLLYHTPVTVNKWLAGQTVPTGCNDNPYVRKYMIVSGSNYMPVDTLPSAFVTDASYHHTEWTIANLPKGGCN